MSGFDWNDDFAQRMHTRLAFGLGNSRNMHAIIRPEPGALPKPLEDAANAMNDAKSDAEAKMAASEFLTLSEEWIDRV